ncbi:MAG: BON domain-containing protein [Gammaproteobacteria bacterium]
MVCNRLLSKFACSVAVCTCVIMNQSGCSSSSELPDDQTAPGRTTGTVIEDQAIEMKAMRYLAKDANIKERTHSNVTSYNTVALVTGEAPTEELHAAVIATVRNVEKVSKVYDEVAIAGPSSLTSRTSDTLLTGKVKTQLFSSKKVQATHIKVVTERGVVYLMGLVPKSQGDEAAEIARRVGGVQKVVKLFEYSD